MKKISETIVFFGSGPVAAQSLELLSRDFNVEAVITKPKPPHHRGEFPVLKVADKLGLPMLLAEDKRSLDDLMANQQLKSKVAVLVDFGIIVSRKVINYFPGGIVNSHFSLLPRWRGADPISFTILAGDKKTGVSLMLIDEGMDTGKLIGQKNLPIAPDATTPSLTHELINLSQAMLIDYLPRYLEGEITPRSQPHPSRATYSRKLTKADGVIDWEKPAEQIEREIRAFIEWPKSRTVFGGKEVIITQAHAIPSNHPEKQPGDIEVIEDTGILMVENSEGYLCIDKIKPAGKREMSAREFLTGYGHLLG